MPRMLREHCQDENDSLGRHDEPGGYDDPKMAQPAWTPEMCPTVIHRHREIVLPDAAAMRNPWRRGASPRRDRPPVTVRQLKVCTHCG